MKKALILILTFAMLLTLTPLGIFAEDTPDASDTTEYLSVSTKEEFLAMEKDKSYKLENDIDFGGTSFESYLLKDFSGNLDGQGHCIYNFTLTGATAADHGVFRYLTPEADGQTIKNFSLGKPDAPISVSYTKTSSFAGILTAAQNSNYSLTLEDVHIYANASIDSTTSAHTGFAGFMGKMSTASLTDCSMNGSISVKTNAKNIYCGGFGGYSNAGVKSFVNCQNNASITAEGSANGMVGGFIGWADASSGAVSYKACENTADISATVTSTTDVAGFCGRANCAYMAESCANYGKISSEADNTIEIGGFFGTSKSTSDFSVTACYNKGEIQTPADNAKVFAGGIMGARYAGVGTIANSINLASVSGAAGTVGALVGTTNKALSLTNCFNYGVITGTTVAAKGFVGGGTACTEADLYDLRGEAVPACTYEALAGVGVQKSDPADNKMNIRFVAGIDSAEFTAVGYDIKIYNAGKVATLSVEDYQVYEQINAKAENGVNTAVTAESQGVNYLIALTLTSVPTTAAFGEVTFVITPYAKNAQGEKVIGHSWMCMVQTGNLILNVNV